MIIPHIQKPWHKTQQFDFRKYVYGVAETRRAFSPTSALLEYEWYIELLCSRDYKERLEGDLQVGVIVTHLRSRQTDLEV